MMFTYSGDRTFDTPARFWEDHLERACRCAEDCPDQEAHAATQHDIPMVSGRYRVTLSALDANELMSDARHYSDYASWGGDSSGIGLQSSARATVTRLAAYDEEGQ